MKLGSSWYFLEHGIFKVIICQNCSETEECLSPCNPEFRNYCEKCERFIKPDEPCYRKRVGRRNKHTVLYCVHCYEGLWFEPKQEVDANAKIRAR